MLSKMGIIENTNTRGIMKIEAGKFYRMRCGGAVKIQNYVAQSPFPFQEDGYLSGWQLNGRYADDDETIFDLIAEISEQEYNRILHGEAYESAVLDKAESAVMKMSSEIEALKSELSALRDTDRMVRDNEEHNLEFDESLFKELVEQAEFKKAQQERDQRRFEAAKAAMQGILANPEFGASWSRGTIIQESQWYGNALLKALEEQK